MKRICSLFFVLILISNGPFYGQFGINYSHKSLYKELSKSTKLDSIKLLEIVNADSVFCNGKFFEILDRSNTCQIGYIYIGRVNTCRSGGCSVQAKSNVSGQSEYFDYYIFFEKDLSVSLVKVFNYQASHGQEVTSSGWLRQFKGYNHQKNLNIGKDIDAISGATISVYSITADIEHITQLVTTLGKMKK